MDMAMFCVYLMVSWWGQRREKKHVVVCFGFVLAEQKLHSALSHKHERWRCPLLVWLEKRQRRMKYRGRRYIWGFVLAGRDFVDRYMREWEIKRKKHQMCRYLFETGRKETWVCFHVFYAGWVTLYWLLFKKVEGEEQETFDVLSCI